MPEPITDLLKISTSLLGLRDIAPEKCENTIDWAISEIRRLREDNERMKEALKVIGDKFDTFCPPEEAMVLREAATKADNEITKLRKVVDAAKECINSCPYDDNAYHASDLNDALRELDEGK